MDRNDLYKNIEETMYKSLINMFIKQDSADDILKGFNEVADHLYTITDDELKVLDLGIKKLNSIDPLWVNRKEENTFREILKMMQEIIDLIWKEHE